MKTGIKTGITAGIAFSLGCMGTVFALENETITAILAKTTNIVLDGEKQNLKNSSGEALYPLMYQDTTYLPVRAISELLELEVSYDADTKSVLLGRTEKSILDLSNTGNHFSSNLTSTIITEGKDLTVTDEDNVTHTFDAGIKLSNAPAALNSDILERGIRFDVTDYETIEFAIKVDGTVDAMVYVCGFLNGKSQIITNFYMSAGEFAEKSVNIRGYDEISFIYTGALSDVRILDPVVK